MTHTRVEARAGIQLIETDGINVLSLRQYGGSHQIHIYYRNTSGPVILSWDDKADRDEAARVIAEGMGEE